MAKKSDDKVLKLARQRFQDAVDREATMRKAMIEDIKFVRLGEQWPEEVKRDRSAPGRERPMLTNNRLAQFRNQVINEMRQNQPAAKIRPVDDDADVETAEILQGLIRHINDVSRADIAIDTAAEWQVDAGLGYIRLITEYCDDDSFDQDIRVKRVPEPLKVYTSPYSEPDGSDMTWAFVVEELTEDEFDATYPGQKRLGWDESGQGDQSPWFENGIVRVAEYFEVETKKRELLLLVDGSKLYLDEIGKEARADAEQYIQRRRKVEEKRVIWRKITGGTVLEETEMPCSFIPIVPVLGNEVWLEGKRSVYGLTRHAKDAARQYNYMQSANTELLALAPRSPYVVAEGQIEGYESEWQQANRINLPYLTYRPVPLLGGLAPAPQRTPPPPANAGFESAMARAVDDMKATMGIYDASLGNRESEQSGKAILSQQQQASIGNFHYSDNLARSVRQVTRIMLEMIPKIYDTARVARILGEDGTPKNVRLDPSAPAAVAGEQGENGEIEKIYNPGVGKYDVAIDTGPSYTTKRSEAAASMMQLVQADPQILPIAGDIIVRNMDWPGAQEIADRMKKALPPNLQDNEEDGQEESPQLQQAAQQMQQMADQMQHMAQVVAELQDKKDLEHEKIEIARYDAETRRLAIEKEIAMVPGALQGQVLSNMQAQLSMAHP